MTQGNRFPDIRVLVWIFAVNNNSYSAFPEELQPFLNHLKYPLPQYTGTRTHLCLGSSTELGVCLLDLVASLYRMRCQQLTRFSHHYLISPRERLMSGIISRRTPTYLLLQPHNLEALEVGQVLPPLNLGSLLGEAALSPLAINVLLLP